MYAIVETGGKQYRVEEGAVLKVERVPFAEGTNFSIDRVLLVAKEEGVTVGSPFVEGAQVRATVVSHGKADKVYIFHYRRKKNYRRFRGHRQPFSEIRIESIAL
jgi:large subunit ribosomal protein L21